ncbi:MAG: dipeptidase, partial [Chitinophagaceae bacterium]
AWLIDTHNDIISTCLEKNLAFDADLSGKTHSDLNRMLKSGLDMQIFSVWCDENQAKPYEWALKEINYLNDIIKKNPDKIMLAANFSDMKKAKKQHKLAAMFGVEGGHMLEEDISHIDSFYAKGVRYLTLTWNNSNSWASSAMDETQKPIQSKGLNEKGKQIVKRMNELGMMVDVSHVGEQTFYDVLATTTKPVIASHSSVYTICPVFRNLKDEQIRAIAQNKGVIHINFYSGFLDSLFFARQKAFIALHKAERDSLLKQNPVTAFADAYLFKKYADEVNFMRASFSLLINHIDYIVKMVGEDYVGIGSDFDGISSTPQRIDDVTNYSLIAEALLERGYSKKAIKKIMGLNFLRVFKANEVN